MQSHLPRVRLSAARWRWFLLLGVCQAALVSHGLAKSAAAPLPSVEVNLDVLRSLAPQTPIESTPLPAVQVPVAPMASVGAGRKVPLENAPYMTPALPAVRHVPAEQPAVAPMPQRMATPRMSAPAALTQATPPSKPPAAPMPVIKPSPPPPAPPPATPSKKLTPPAAPAAVPPSPPIAAVQRPTLAPLPPVKTPVPAAPVPSPSVAEKSTRVPLPVAAPVAVPDVPPLATKPPPVIAPAPTIAPPPAPVPSPAPEAAASSAPAAVPVPPPVAAPARVLVTEPGDEEAAKAAMSLPDSVLSRIKHMYQGSEKTGVVSDTTTVKAALPASPPSAPDANVKPAALPKPSDTLPPEELPPAANAAAIKKTPAEAPAAKQESAPAAVPPPVPVAPVVAPAKPAASAAATKPPLPSLAAITHEKPPVPVASPLAAPPLPKLNTDDDHVTVPQRELPEVKVGATENKPVALPAEPETAYPPHAMLASELKLQAPSTPEDKTAPPESSPVAALPDAKPAVAKPTPPIMDGKIVAVAKPALPDTSGGGESHALRFDKEKTELNDTAKSTLSDLAESVKKAQSNVRITAYASGIAEEASVARRISLSRALQIRAYLIAKGVNPLSITVQALGNQNNTDSAEVVVK